MYQPTIQDTSEPGTPNLAATEPRLPAISQPIPGTTTWARVLRSGILVSTDLVALAVAAIGAYFLWARPVLHQSGDIYLPLLPLLILFPLSFAAGDLYPGFGIGAVQTLRRLWLRTSFVVLALMSFTFSFKLPHTYSRVTVGLMWLGALVAVPLERYVVLSIAQCWKGWREPAVLIGSSDALASLEETLNAALSLGYGPVAMLESDEDRGEDCSSTRSAVKYWGTLTEAPAIAAMGVRVAFVVNSLQTTDWRTLDFLHQHFRHVIVIQSMTGAPVEGVVIRDLGGVLGLEFTNQLLIPQNRIVKRCLDIALSSLLLVLLAPIIALAALTIKWRDRGPAFYFQSREGEGGRLFKVWKLRTMFVDATNRLDRFLASSPRAQEEWKRRFKLTKDPRIIPGIGHFLRRFSVDEIPQLWNVLRGEMSLVGPRPFPQYHLQEFPPGFLALRRRVRPGMTGLWQVMIRSAGSIEEQEAFDTHYIRNWSIWMDIYILAKTTTAVIFGRGAR